MTKNILFLFVLLAYTHALTFGESTGILYNINKRRYEAVLVRVKDSQYDKLKTTLLKTIAVNYCLTWEQAWKLISLYSTQEEKVNGFEALNNNIIDTKNRPANITDEFPEGPLRAKIKELISQSETCKVEANAPDSFPPSSFYFKEIWNDRDIDMLAQRVEKIPQEQDKLALINSTLNATNKGLTYTQVLKLYDLFIYSGDKTNLTVLAEDKIVGLTCEQVNVFQKDLLHDYNRLIALDALKSSVTDYENRLNLLDSFTFDNTKELVRISLETVKINDRKKEEAGSFWTIILIILVIAAVGGAGYVWYQKKSRNTQKDNPYINLEVNDSHLEKIY